MERRRLRVARGLVQGKSLLGAAVRAGLPPPRAGAVAEAAPGAVPFASAWILSRLRRPDITIQGRCVRDESRIR